MEGTTGTQKEYKFEPVERPGAAYSGVMRNKSLKLYEDGFELSVRRIEDMSDELKKKLTNGGVNAEKLWKYINRVAETYLGKQNFDPQDSRLKAVYAQINGTVERFGTAGLTSDLLKSVAAQYIETARTNVGEKNRTDFASLGVEQGKKALRIYARVAGEDDAYDKRIDDIKDPTKVEQLAAELDEKVRARVVERIAQGNFPSLEKIVDEDKKVTIH